MKNEIKRIFERNHGIATAKEIKQGGFYYPIINRLLQEGTITRLKQGYYQWVAEKEPDEISIIVRLFPDGVLCMDTALFYYGYSDRTPAGWHIAVSKDSSKTRFKLDYPFVKPYFIEPSCLKIGAVSEEMDGITVKIYDRERVICDCLRYSSKIDKEIFNKAILVYVSDNKKNIRNLIEYAKRFNVYKKMQTWIGVWL